MKKIFYFFISIIFISTIFELHAQYDARRLPEYLDATKANLPIFSSRLKKFIIKTFPPKLWQNIRALIKF